MEVRRDFTPTQILMMVGMLEVRNMPHLNISMLAKAIDVSASSPAFRDVLAHLIDLGIVVIYKEVGSSKFITIDQDSLVERVLDEQHTVNVLVDKYLAVHHHFIW